MQLIEFETRLEKNESEDSDRLYAFKTYAKVTLNFKDAKDIELTSTALHVGFLDSINWEEGTAFFEPFYLGRWEHRFRKEETIDAFHRLCENFNDIWEKNKEFSKDDTREDDLSTYYWNRNCIVEEVLQLEKSLELRNKYNRKCMLSLSSEECELLGIKDCYPETIGDQIYDLVNTEKHSPCTDVEAIASLESAYSQGIE